MMSVFEAILLIECIGDKERELGAEGSNDENDETTNVKRYHRFYNLVERRARYLAGDEQVCREGRGYEPYLKVQQEKGSEMERIYPVSLSNRDEYRAEQQYAGVRLEKHADDKKQDINRYEERHGRG